MNPVGHGHDLHQLVCGVAEDHTASLCGRIDKRDHGSVGNCCCCCGCCCCCCFLFSTTFSLSFVQDPTGFETTRDTLCESAPFTTSPTLWIDFTTFRRTRKLLERLVLHCSPEEGLAAVAGLTAVVDVLAGVAAADEASRGVAWACFCFLRNFFWIWMNVESEAGAFKGVRA